jgi:hypothetical protein
MPQHISSFLLHLIKFSLALFVLFFGSVVWAEIEIKAETNMFYTDDVSIFSASQRLSHLEDPTQPVIEVTGEGEDIIFEPVISFGKSFEPTWGDMQLTTQVQGFIFNDHSEFDHITIGTKITQSLGNHTLLRFRYHFGPDLFLGFNKEKQSGGERAEKEVVTTHFGAVEIEKDFSESLMVRLLSRYGERSYNKSFSQRDTSFWTTGTHVEWKFASIYNFVLGYHYERGLSAGRNLPQFKDDISSITHYVVSELEIGISENTSIKLGFDFEKNIFTSEFLDDELRNANERVFQGEVGVSHEFNDHFELSVSYLHGERKFNFEPNSAQVNTVQIGGVYWF